MNYLQDTPTAPLSLLDQAVNLAARAMIVESDRDEAWVNFCARVETKVTELEREHARETLEGPIEELLRKGVEPRLIGEIVADLTDDRSVVGLPAVQEHFPG